MILIAPQHLRLCDQPAGSCGPTRRNRQHGRSAGIRLADIRPWRLLDSLGDQFGHRIVVVGPLSPRPCAIAGLELLDDLLDSPMSGAAELRGPR